MLCFCYFMLQYGVIKEGGVWGECDTYGGRREMNDGVWGLNLKERDHLEDLGMLGWMIPKWILEELVVRLGNCFIWPRTGMRGGLL